MDTLPLAHRSMVSGYPSEFMDTLSRPEESWSLRDPCDDSELPAPVAARLKKSMAQAAAGQFASPEEVAAVFAKYGC